MRPGAPPPSRSRRKCRPCSAQRQDRPGDEQGRTSVSIHLFLEGLLSIVKAAELAGEPRLAFERQLAALGLSTVRYVLVGYETDRAGIAEAERVPGEGLLQT